MTGPWNVPAWFEHPWVGMILLTLGLGSVDSLICCFRRSGRQGWKISPSQPPPVCPILKQSVSRVRNAQLRPFAVGTPALVVCSDTSILLRNEQECECRSRGGRVHLNAWAKVLSSFCILLVKSSDWEAEFRISVGQPEGDFESS